MPALLIDAVLCRLGLVASLLAVFEVTGRGTSIHGEAPDLEPLRWLKTKKLAALLMHLLIILLDPAVFLPQLLHFPFHLTVPLLVDLLLMRYLLIDLLHLLVDLLN